MSVTGAHALLQVRTGCHWQLTLGVYPEAVYPDFKLGLDQWGQLLHWGMRIVGEAAETQLSPFIDSNDLHVVAYPQMDNQWVGPQSQSDLEPTARGC
jgi:hypothetical protein